MGGQWSNHHQHQQQHHSDRRANDKSPFRRFVLSKSKVTNMKALQPKPPTSRNNYPYPRQHTMIPIYSLKTSNETDIEPQGSILPLTRPPLNRAIPPIPESRSNESIMTNSGMSISESKHSILQMSDYNQPGVITTIIEDTTPTLSRHQPPEPQAEPDERTTPTKVHESVTMIDDNRTQDGSLVIVNGMAKRAANSPTMTRSQSAENTPTTRLRGMPAVPKLLTSQQTADKHTFYQSPLVTRMRMRLGRLGHKSRSLDATDNRNTVLQSGANTNTSSETSINTLNYDCNKNQLPPQQQNNNNKNDTNSNIMEESRCRNNNSLAGGGEINSVRNKLQSAKSRISSILHKKHETTTPNGKSFIKRGILLKKTQSNVVREDSPETKLIIPISKSHESNVKKMYQHPNHLAIAPLAKIEPSVVDNSPAVEMIPGLGPRTTGIPVLSTAKVQHHTKPYSDKASRVPRKDLFNQSSKETHYQTPPVNQKTSSAIGPTADFTNLNTSRNSALNASTIICSNILKRLPVEEQEITLDLSPLKNSMLDSTPDSGIKSSTSDSITIEAEARDEVPALDRRPSRRKWTRTGSKTSQESQHSKRDSMELAVEELNSVINSLEVDNNRLISTKEETAAIVTSKDKEHNLRPPTQLTRLQADMAGNKSVQFDCHTYNSLIQDVLAAKTLLLKLRTVLQTQDGMNPILAGGGCSLPNTPCRIDDEQHFIERTFSSAVQESNKLLTEEDERVVKLVKENEDLRNRIRYLEQFIPEEKI